MTWTIYIDFSSPFPRRLHENLALIGQAVSVEKIYENGGHMHVYIPGAGADTPLSNLFSLTVLFSQFSPLLQAFLI